MTQHNLALLAEQSFERHGDRPSLFWEGKTFTSGELRERALRLSTGLKELGIEPGDRVVVMMANCPEVGISYIALWTAGAAITPAIFLLSADDLHHILEDSEAKAVITTPEFLATVQQAAEGVDTLKFVISTGAEQEGVIPLSSLEEAEPGVIVPRDSDDLAALMYTGGTTGRAKGVMLSHENLWWAGRASWEASQVPGINRTLVPLPLSHSFGLIVTVVGLHAEEPGDAILMTWFDPTGWLELVQEHKAQNSPMVPTMLQILLASPLENYDLSSLKYIVSGASPLSLDVVTEFEKRVPSVHIRQGYGLTETSASMTVTQAGSRKLGSVGPPSPGFNVKIVDDEGNEVPRGEEGEIICKAQAVMLGYWRAEEATHDSIKDGYFYTGDIGKLDEDGDLWILDRKKDLILRGGFNVFPRDVEDALVEHPAVAVAGVVGKPDPVKGEEVVAFVQLNPGAEVTEAELLAFSKERLSKYKYPREIRIVENVPLTPVFKIDRKKLRTLL
ncbi:MAG: long-chain acyl-CoA synthetase [Actinomycetota bacterium]|jgi:long-chain acyl-CoA synthetase|nr:long-chain acyl-CoA synthetase [Actinomycetota bacterium]